MNKRILFKGNFLYWLLCFLGLLALCTITFGLATPFMIYWNIRYFVSHLEIES